MWGEHGGAKMQGRNGICTCMNRLLLVRVHPLTKSIKEPILPFRHGRCFHVEKIGAIGGSNSCLEGRKRGRISVARVPPFFLNIPFFLCLNIQERIFSARFLAQKGSWYI